MQLSAFGKKFTRDVGIIQLMKDLGEALADAEGVFMLGGGNPAHIPEVQARFREAMRGILDRPGDFAHLIGDYSSPQGERAFVEALADLLRREYGWEIGPEHIALTNGSQTAFFFLFNLLAGPTEEGRHRRILLPVAPEYIGYADVGLSEDFFVASRPDIEFLGDHLFKYRVNFDALTVTDDIGAICVSRPTNPTGNVLTEEELRKLGDLARAHDIPLIVDNAYGLPFPNIIYTESRPIWDEHIVLCMSLSKLGLPGVRTGIVVGRPELIDAITSLNAIVSLAPNSFGALLTLELVRSGELVTLCRELIRPYYWQKAQQALAWIEEFMGDLDYYVHKPEGAFFCWLWFKDLPITSHELYERLKARQTLVVPGEYFFPGLGDTSWRHRYECIRVNYAGDAATVREGLRIIAEEARRAYAEASPRPFPVR